MARWLRVLALVASGLAFVSSSAVALTVEPVPLEQLVAQADGIVRGQVVDKSVEWDAGHRAILTRYTLQVLESVKGYGAGLTVTFTELGGEIDGIGMAVPGAPAYRVGDEVVLFLHAEAGRLMTLRWEQGQFTVDRGPDKRTARVRQASGRVDEPLDAFLTRIRAMLEAR